MAKTRTRTKTKAEARPLKPPPYQRRRLRTARRDVAVVDQQPQVELAIYDDLVLLRRRTSHGGWRSYPVDSAAVAQVLARVPSASGLLPDNVLGTGFINGQAFVVQFVAPGMRRVQLSGELLTIPLPALVWAWRGSDYRVYALGGKQRPQRAEVPLYVAPLPNTYDSGAICWGDVTGTERTQATPQQVFTTYLEESGFNLHIAGGKSRRFPQSVVALWRELIANKAKAYPTDDLVATRHDLAWLLRGGPWL